MGLSELRTQKPHYQTIDEIRREQAIREFNHDRFGSNLLLFIVRGFLNNPDKLTHDPAEAMSVHIPKILQLSDIIEASSPDKINVFFYNSIIKTIHRITENIRSGKDLTVTEKRLVSASNLLEQKAKYKGRFFTAIWEHFNITVHLNKNATQSDT